MSVQTAEPGAEIVGENGLTGLLRKPLAVISLAFVLLVGILVALAPVIAPYGPLEQDLSATLQMPSAAHLLGTDTLGRDVLSRLLYGGQPALLGALSAVAIYIVLGIVMGLMAGYSDGVADRVLGMIVDILMSLPGLVVMFAVLSIFSNNLYAAMATLGLFSAGGLMRVVRAGTKATRAELYVSAARVSGVGTVSILFRHILPRLVGPIVVQVSLFFGVALIVQSGLGFLNLGVVAPAPSWGGMVGEAAQVISAFPWLLFVSGGMIGLMVLAGGLIGDAVRDLNAERKTRSGGHRARSHRTAGSTGISSSPDLLLDVRGLSIAFESRNGARSVVSGVDLGVRADEIVGLVGESGSGKTVTALSTLGLLGANAVVTADTMSFAGTPLLGLRPAQMRAIRGAGIAYIAQEPMIALDPAFTIGNQLQEVVRAKARLGRAATRARALELLGSVRLPDPEAVMRRYPHELSGGMAQRVAIALALAGDPRLLIADEPTTALDVTVQAEILDLLRQLHVERGMAVLLVTHDLGVVADLCDRVVVMKSGRVVDGADVHTLFREPGDQYTRDLIAATPSILAVREEEPPAAAAVGDGMPVLAVEDLRVVFEVRAPRPFSRAHEFTAVDGVSFAIAPGETLALVGESGSGKSTIGNAILGLVPRAGGSVELGGTPIDDIDAKARVARLQVVFQNPYGSLNPSLTVGQILAEPLIASGALGRAESRERIAELLGRVGMPADTARRYVGNFSGGQRQRIAIARALAGSPDVIVCDEPTSALDVSTQRVVLELLAELQEDLGVSYLFITHDLAVVRQFAHRVGVLKAGRLVETGTAEQVCGDPQDAYTRRLLQSAPVPDPIVQAQRRSERLVAANR